MIQMIIHRDSVFCTPTSETSLVGKALAIFRTSVLNIRVPSANGAGIEEKVLASMKPKIRYMSVEDMSWRVLEEGIGARQELVSEG
jgi:hypothetical protein